MVTFNTTRPNFYTRSTETTVNKLNSQGGTNSFFQGGSNPSYSSSNLGNKSSRTKLTPGVSITSDINTASRSVAGLGIGVGIDTNGRTTVGATYDSGSGISVAASVGSNRTLNPVTNRLSIAGLSIGGIYNPGITSSPLPEDTSDVFAAFDEDYEDRVIISDQTGEFIGSSSAFRPLENTGGVLFPITPLIIVA